jgi:hypothetical protein
VCKAVLALLKASTDMLPSDRDITGLEGHSILQKCWR